MCASNGKEMHIIKLDFQRLPEGREQQMSGGARHLLQKKANFQGDPTPAYAGARSSPGTRLSWIRDFTPQLQRISSATGYPLQPPDLETDLRRPITSISAAVSLIPGATGPRVDLQRTVSIFSPLIILPVVSRSQNVFALSILCPATQEQ